MNLCPVRRGLEEGKGARLRPDRVLGPLRDDPTVRSVTWRRLDRAEIEFCRLLDGSVGPALAGIVVGTFQGRPILSRYRVDCTPTWETREAKVEVIRGDGGRSATSITVGPSGRWQVDGTPRPDLNQCVDIDLGITPATNTLPIRRLQPARGETLSISSAWVRFPDLVVQPLPQAYRSHGDNRYLYESQGGAFSAELEVDELGLVTRYRDLWERVACWP